MSIILFLIILLVLVLVHEFGHFITAKKSGMRVDAFAFGFGPKLFSWKKGETTYSFNLFPLGGYVKIFGENPDEESVDGPQSTRSFTGRPKYQQAIVLFAGIVMNLLLAWVLLSFGYIAGLPTPASEKISGSYIENPALTITSVMKNSPAEKAGLKIGDTISNFTSPEELHDFVVNHADSKIALSVVHQKINSNVLILPEKNFETGVPAIGISMDVIGTMKLPFFRAFYEGAKLTVSETYSIGKGLIGLIHDAVLGKANFSDVTGPVGIVGIVGDAVKFGFVYLLSFTALISINLAVINLFPFPALDGGRLLFLLIEKIKGSPINPKVANTINAIGFGLLLLLMAIVTFHDILKLFH